MLTRPRPPFPQITQGIGKSLVSTNLIFIPRFDRRTFALNLHTIPSQSTHTEQLLNMATSNTIHLTTEDTGVFKFKSQDSETATKTSQLLQENHDVRSLTPSSYGVVLAIRPNIPSIPIETSHLLQCFGIPQPYCPSLVDIIWPWCPSIHYRATIQTQYIIPAPN